MATVTLRGARTQTNGALPAVGAPAPDFLLVDTDLQNRSLADYRGIKKLLNIVPSLDTPVCAASAKSFNAEARDDVVMLVVSADLPFAMERFCRSAKLAQLRPLSLMRSRKFAKDYGVLIQDGPLAGICTRAVVVIDEVDRVLYTELVAEITRQPDYERALAALDER